MGIRVRESEFVPLSGGRFNMIIPKKKKTIIKALGIVNMKKDPEFTNF